ncbi:hypothetical protein [uncultured Sneathia sp.]|uniref:hypothetical protein n=1 Tax=uncultured Sneathia sp. TaxID=278067 RepID=UPI002599367F|nr:hypothetical protein [uncultured Sneathia sp.]
MKNTVILSRLLYRIKQHFKFLTTKKLLISFLVIMTNITLAKNLDNFVYYTNVIEGTKHVDLQAVDFEFADYFLTQLKIDREVSSEFLVILPDVSVLEKNKEKLSKLGKEIFVFLLKEKNDKLKNRSIKELKDKKFPKNVQIILVSLDDEETERFIADTKDNSLYKQDYFKYKFYRQYKKRTNYDYLGVINK